MGDGFQAEVVSSQFLTWCVSLGWELQLSSGLQLWSSLTGLTDGAAVVGFEGGVDTVGRGTVGDAAVHLPVGLTAAALTPGHLRDARMELKKKKNREA